jgi:hypothetical protein
MQEWAPYLSGQNAAFQAGLKLIYYGADARRTTEWITS